MNSMLSGYKVTRTESGVRHPFNEFYATRPLAEAAIARDIEQNRVAFGRPDYEVEAAGLSLVGFDPPPTLAALKLFTMTCDGEVSLHSLALRAELARAENSLGAPDGIPHVQMDPETEAKVWAFHGRPYTEEEREDGTEYPGADNIYAYLEVHPEVLEFRTAPAPANMSVAVDDDLAGFIRGMASTNGIDPNRYANNLLEKGRAAEGATPGAEGVTFTLRAEAGTNRLAVRVRASGEYLEVRPDGFGERAADDGHGAPVLLDLRPDHLELVVFGDINSEEPTHVIGLEGAREDRRTGED